MPNRSSLLVMRAALRVAWADLGAVYTWRSWTLGWTVRVVAQVAFFALIGRLLGSQDRVVFLLVGATALVVAMANMNAVASTTWERRAGTLGLLVASPQSPIPVFVGRSAQWILDGFATGVVSLGVVSFLLGIAWPVESLVLGVIVLGAVSVGSYCFSLFLGSLVLRSPGLRTVVASAGYLSLAILCGVVVPTNFLPTPVVAISLLLPLTHGVEAFRIALAGGSGVALGASLGLLAVTSTLWLAGSSLLFRRYLERGRTNGTLEFG